MRNLRFRLSGYLMAAVLWVMPRSRQRDLFIDALDRWMSDTAHEFTGQRITFRVHARYR